MKKQRKFIDKLAGTLVNYFECHNCPISNKCGTMYDYETCKDTLIRWLNDTYEEVENDK